jgi:predicted PurR-regulated permease PerM
MLCAALRSPNWPGRPPGWSIDPRHTRNVGGLTIPIGWRGAIVAAAMLGSGVLIWKLLQRTNPAIAWLLIGGFVAVALSRPIALLERRTRLSRQAAAALLLGTIAAILLLVTVAGVDDGARATTTVTERLPQVVADLEDTRIIGPWLRERDASVWIDEQMNDIPQRLERAQPEQWLPTVGARLVDLFWTALFAMALLIDGPRLLEAIRRRVPARHRRQYMRITAATGTALAGYAAGAALVASLNATVVFTIAIVLGVGQPAVIGAAIDVAPWGTLIAALVGGAAAGVIGAVVITPLVGVIRVIRSELAREDFPGTVVRADLASEEQMTPVAAGTPSPQPGPV